MQNKVQDVILKIEIHTQDIVLKILLIQPLFLPFPRQISFCSLFFSNGGFTGNDFRILLDKISDPSPFCRPLRGVKNPRADFEG
jgi:hypothetical protein